jgi:hypothetical protein
MKLTALVVLLYGAAASLPIGLSNAGLAFQEPGKQSQIAVDPQTGRAVGATEIAPDGLQKLIAQKAKMILIDVRDEAQYQQETIKGAIHIPMAELESRLKEIPKDTILVFT